MLLNLQLTKPIQISSIPREMRMRISQPTHQRPSPSLKNSHFRILLQLVCIWYFSHFGDSLAFDEDIPTVGLPTCRIEDVDVCEEDAGVGVCSEDVVVLGLEVGGKVDSINIGNVTRSTSIGL